jgi:chemotaxis family two-component system sensor kinase Cph1
MIILEKDKSALLKSEEKFRTVADYTYDWEYWISDKGALKYISPSCKRITGYEIDEFVENNELLLNIVHPDDKPILLEHLKHELDVLDVFHLDFRIITKKGEERWISHYCQPVYNRDGKYQGRRASNRDISERKQIEAELIEHADLIKQFANTVSHDHKNPAISIYGLAKLVKEKHQKMSAEKFDKFCEQIMISAEQISSLAEDINTYLSTREAPLYFSSFDLEQICQTIREEFSSRLKEQNISWRDPDIKVPAIWADKQALLRIIRNLVDNALKYGGSDLSEIFIKCEESDTYHIVSVQNNGKCIPSEDCEAIFRTFNRGSSESESTKKGTGLGLAIVREVAKQHNGSAWVTSSPNGKTTFYVTIKQKL